MPSGLSAPLVALIQTQSSASSYTLQRYRNQCSKWSVKRPFGIDARVWTEPKGVGATGRRTRREDKRADRQTGRQTEAGAPVCPSTLPHGKRGAGTGYPVPWFSISCTLTLIRPYSNHPSLGVDSRARTFCAISRSVYRNSFFLPSLAGRIARISRLIFFI